MSKANKYGKKCLAGALAAVLAASLLGGCGGGNSDSGTTAAATEAATTQGTTEAAAETQTTAPAEETTTAQETTEAAGATQAAEEEDLAAEIRGNTDPTPEQIELVNSTLNDSYLGDAYDSIGSDYSAYDGRFDGVTLDVWYNDPGKMSTIFPDLSQSPFFKQFTELTGIKLNFIIPTAGEERTEFNLMVTGKELPDVMFNVGGYYNGGILAAESDGLIVNLSEYEDKLPNYMYCIEHSEGSELLKKDLVADNGHRLGIYILYLKPSVMTSGLIIKTKAMEDAGWTEVPETVDEWHTFLTDCKNAGYTVPLVFGNNNGFLLNAYGAFATAFGVHISTYVKDDGTIGYGPAEPGLKDYLETMNKWYSEGLFDPDYISGDSAHRQQMIASDLSAAVIVPPDTAANLTKGTWGEDLVAAPLPVMNKGDQPVADYSRTYHSTITAPASISTQCENIDAALAFLDFFYTKRGAELSMAGTYGDVHLIDENGEVYLPEDSLRYTDPEIQEYGGMYVYKYISYAFPQIQFPVHSADPVAEINGQALTDTENFWTDAKLVGYPSSATPTVEESASIADISTNINTAQNEYLTKIVIGQLPLSEVDTFQKTIQEMGLDQLLAVRQAAYDRYMAR